MWNIKLIVQYLIHKKLYNFIKKNISVKVAVLKSPKDVKNKKLWAKKYSQNYLKKTLLPSVKVKTNIKLLTYLLKI